MLSFLNCTHFDARLSLFNFRCIMYSLQIHKQAIVLTTRGESKCTHFRMFGHLPAYTNFKKTNPPQFGDHNHTMAGTPSLAAAPGGAADATAPSAGSVPPPLGVP